MADICVSEKAVEAEARRNPYGDAAEMLRELRRKLTKAEKNVCILEIKNSHSLANNLCPDCRDKQAGKPCLACTIQTLTRRLTKAEQELRTAQSAERALRMAVSEVGAIGGASWGAHYTDKIRKRAAEILADIEKGK